MNRAEVVRWRAGLALLQVPTAYVMLTAQILTSGPCKVAGMVRPSFDYALAPLVRSCEHRSRFQDLFSNE
eukprot:4329975-Amphidinium_carterae.1